eukprot:765521-Hanusia_phi.AAC.13
MRQPSGSLHKTTPTSLPSPLNQYPSSRTANQRGFTAAKPCYVLEHTRTHITPTHLFDYPTFHSPTPPPQISPLCENRQKSNRFD